MNTAILAQAAEIERDGTGLMPDGSVPALISWEPDSINSPRSPTQCAADCRQFRSR